MTDEVIKEETQEERYARQEKERQAKFDAEQAQYRATMDKLEAAIAPLTFKPPRGREDDPNWGYMTRDILSDGERVGHITYTSSGYSYQRRPMQFSVSSPRIPTQGRYSYREGARRYKKFDSAVAGIKKFCLPVSDDEKRAEVLRKELRQYRQVLSDSQKRSISVDGQGWTSPTADSLVRLLASPIKQDQIEGAEYLRVLVRKKKVHVRWSTWLKDTFITPRLEELNALDTSKEKIN